MNKSVIQFIITVLLANLSIGCNSETGSALNAEDGDIHNDFVQQTVSIGLVCPSDTLVILIGSSEAASKVAEWNIETPSREKIEEDGKISASKFQAAIEKARTDLMTSFSHDPKCRKPFELVFASIIDGPNSLDSSIETTHFGLAMKEGSSLARWKKSNTKSWAFSENSLVPREYAFELNTATDVGEIIQILTKNKLESITGDKKLVAGKTIIPAQIHYVIKTHGARIATDERYQPTLENMKDFPRHALSASQWQSGILMDTHGPTTVISSSVFSAHWNPAAIQAALSVNSPGVSPPDRAADGALDYVGDKDANRNTSADGIFDTAGEYGMTSGSKSLAFQQTLIKNSEATYSGKKVLGSFAAYANIRGTSPSMGAASLLSLPVGNVSNAGKNLIILDSCYASEEILDAIEYAQDVKGQTIVLTSVNELYFEFFDYSKLDLAGFLKMPTLLEKLKRNNNLIEGEKELLANMSSGKLEWRSDDSKSDFKKIAIWAD